MHHATGTHESLSLAHEPATSILWLHTMELSLNTTFSSFSRSFKWYGGIQLHLPTLPLQTATIYRDNGRLLAKEYSFKIQHARGSDSTAVRKTVGKIKIDMSQFCTEDTAPIPQEVFLQLK